MKGLDVMPPAEPTLPDEPELRYLPLAGLLPETHQLALQPDLGLVARLYADTEGVPRLQHVQWFTPIEMALVLALVEQYPHYCPYEVLLAHFTSIRVSEQVIERMRGRAGSGTRSCAPCVTCSRACGSSCAPSASRSSSWWKWATPSSRRGREDRKRHLVMQDKNDNTPRYRKEDHRMK